MVLERLSRSEIAAYKKQNDPFEAIPLDKLVTIDSATLSPLEYSALLSCFRDLPGYKLIDNAVTTSLTSVLIRANQIRIREKMEVINRNTSLLSEFYKQYGLYLPEIICHNHMYRIPHPFSPQVVKRVAGFDVEKPLVLSKERFFRKHTVSLGFLIREANSRRKQAGLGPLPGSGSSLGAFYDVICNMEPFKEIRVFELDTGTRRYGILFQDTNAIIEALMNIEYWRNEDELRVYFSSGFAKVLAEFTSNENYVFKDIFIHAHQLVEKYTCNKTTPEDQPDIVGRIMEKLIPYLEGRVGSFESAQKLINFISTVCHTSIVDFYRAQSKNRAIQYRDKAYSPFPLGRQPEEQFLLSEGENIVSEAMLADLTPKQRRALELKMQGFSIHEIAVLVSQEENQLILENVIKSRLHRARNRISRFVERNN